MNYNKKQFINQYVLNNCHTWDIEENVRIAEGYWEELTDLGYGEDDSMLMVCPPGNLDTEGDDTDTDAELPSTTYQEQYYHGDVEQSFRDLRNQIDTLEEDVKNRDNQTRERITNVGIPKPKPSPTKEWKDNGKHLKRSIEDWEHTIKSIKGNFFVGESGQHYHVNFTQEDLDLAELRLQYAKAFKANDPTGYRKMHSGKGGV